MRLLLVDDDAGLRALLRATFETFDVSVEEAEDVAAAEQRIAKRRPDVVVLDVHMPGTSGLDLTRRLKADPGTRATFATCSRSSGRSGCSCRRRITRRSLLCSKRSNRRTSGRATTDAASRGT